MQPECLGNAVLVLGAKKHGNGDEIAAANGAQEEDMPRMLKDVAGDLLDHAGAPGLFAQGVGQVGEEVGEEQCPNEVAHPSDEEVARILKKTAFAFYGGHGVPHGVAGVSSVSKLSESGPLQDSKRRNYAQLSASKVNYYEAHWEEDTLSQS